MSNTKLILKMIGTENDNTNVITDSIAINSETEDRDVSEISRVFQKAIPDASANVELLDGVEADSIVIIYVDQEVDIDINSSSDSFIVKPISAGVKTPVLLFRGELESITVSNNSGSVANIDVTRVKV